MNSRRVLLAAALAVLLAGCSAGSASDRAQKLADDATKAVYNDDMTGLTANMNAALVPTITRAQLGDLADKMHALGDYQGLTPAGSDTLKSEYDFKAKFDKGTWTVMLRLDGDGKIAAYRVAPSSPGG
jgi:predicted component of type VI protein secretion system